MAMDLTAAAAARISPDSDSETPSRPTPNKPMGFLAYANGALKRHYPTAPVVTKLELPATAATAPAVSYKECMRNHAASIGGHALDGCCEFMPSPMFNPSDPTSLCCAACGCHRNFHRRDPDDPAPLQLHRHNKSPFRRPLPPSSDSPSSPPPPANSPFFSSAPHMLMALKNPSGNNPATAPAATQPANGVGKHSAAGSGGKKRFRTKFSQKQKEKMYEFSEKLGWKLQKIDKSAVEEFCNEVGVGKEVLKVWMHNNKNTLGRREINNGGNGSNSANKNGDHGFYSDTRDEEEDENKNMGRNGGGSHNGSHFEHVHLVSANGSSSG